MVAAALAVLSLVAPGAALGHAVLRGTEPSTGATLDRQPEQISFRFSEPVEARFGAIRIHNSRAEQVESGEAFHPDGETTQLAERLQPELPEGTYTATYRVISADGHPVSGGLVFSIGRASANPGQTVSELLEQRTEAGPVTDIGFGVARGLQYASIALAIGAAFFVLAIWLPALGLVAGGTSDWREASERFLGRLRRMLALTVLVAVLSSAAGIVFQGATAAGVSFWSALDPDIWGEVLETRFGTVWGLRLLVWVALGAIVAVTFARGYRPVLQPASLGATGVVRPGPARISVAAAVALPLVFLALSVSLAGHASLQDPAAVLIPANVLHVLAVSVWAGGLALLVFALPQATRRLTPPDRTRLLAATLARFSTIAGIAILVLVVGGVVQSLFEVRSISNLTGTAFGRAVLIKICLFVGLLALGAYNRRRMVPALRRIAAQGGGPRVVGTLLRRTLRTEVALIVAVMGVTAALVSYAPSVAVSGGPVSITRSLGPADLQLTVDPARVGPNAVHVFLTDKRTGAQYDRVKEFTAQLALPEEKIGPIDQSVRKAGPGHYVFDGAVFGADGDWKLEVAARVSAFDAYYDTLEIPIK
jgi:copper transport protein